MQLMEHNWYKEMYLSQKRKVDALKKTLGKRWRAPEGYEDLVFVTTMGSPVVRYHAEKEIKKGGVVGV